MTDDLKLTTASDSALISALVAEDLGRVDPETKTPQVTATASPTTSVAVGQRKANRGLVMECQWGQ